MAAPTAYTEVGLGQFMLHELGNVAGALGWVNAQQVQPAIDEALLVYGVADIASATDVRKLRALARVQVWRLAVQSLAADYDFRADGGDYKRSQLFDRASKALDRAVADAAEYDPAPVSYGAVVGVDSVVSIHDPYVMLTDEEAVLP